MAVRNSVQRFVGCCSCKRWEGKRTGLQRASPQTFWQMWGFILLKAAKQRKGLWIKGLLLSFLCSALSPAACNQIKGQAIAWRKATGVSPGKKNKQKKTIKCGGWIFTFPSLAIALVTLKPLLLYIFFSLLSDVFLCTDQMSFISFYFFLSKLTRAPDKLFILIVMV